MAPLDLGDRINLWSMIGTWVGTLATLFGLVAVIAQLRTLLKDFSDDRKETVKNAAGDYAICIPALSHLDVGHVEGKAPSIRSWINYYYHHDKDILVTPYERALKGGQSSWSKLFARLQIRPQELKNLGGPESKYEEMTRSNFGIGCYPRQVDLLIDGAKISYGMHGDEFAALLILSGISPSKFHPQQTSNAVSHLGRFFLGAHDTFSQIAQFDGTMKNLRNFQNYEGAGRFAHSFNVRRCIDLALGILRVDCVGREKILTFNSKKNLISLNPDFLDLTNSSAEEILTIRQNLTHIAGGSPELDPLYDVAGGSFNYIEDIRDRQIEWQIPLPDSIGLISGDGLDKCFKMAFALTAIKPWGFPLVISRHLIAKFRKFLSFSFDYSKVHSPPILTREFRALPSKLVVEIPGWTRSSMDKALDSLSDINQRGFSGLSSRSALYYDAMIVLFQHHKLRFESIQIGMAARCCTTYFASLSKVKPESGTFEILPDKQFCAFIRERINAAPMDEPPFWAMEVLVTYLHAWLQGAHAVDDDFRQNFRRRVFLG
jgi:hypothetical protein